MVIKNTNHLYLSILQSSDKFALWISNKVGTMGFFAIVFIWTVFWLSWNMFAPAVMRFDPYPAFVMWLFISNMIQIFLMPLMLIGQNLQGKHAEIRGDNDFEINKKSELEIAELKKELGEISEMLRALTAKVK